MTLQLKKIHFKNWKCYLEQIIKFDLDTNPNLDVRKNILVIAGQNGAGKTSFQQGILWCLYGKDVIRSQDLIECFNRINIKKNPELELLVQLTFIDEQHTYEIQRVAKIIKRGSTSLANIEDAKFYLDGQLKPDAKERIESLLPRSCREFFFFDGTKIDEYAKLTHNQETKEAIERTLGIPEIRNLRDDAQGVVEKLSSKLREASKTRNKLQEAIAESTTLKQEIAAKKGQIKNIKNDLGQYEIFLQDSELRISQIEELTKKQAEIKEDEQQKEKWEKEVDRLESEIGIAIQNSPIVMLSNLIREATDDLESKTAAKTRFSVNVDLLKELVSENICVCGRCLDNDAYLFIQQQIDILEQASQSSQEIIELSNISAQLRRLTNFQSPDIYNLLEQRNILKENIDEIEQAIKRKQLETSNFDSEEAKIIWEKQGRIKGDISNCKARTQRIEEEVLNLQQQLNKSKSQQEKLASEDKSTNTLNRQKQLAERLQEASDELINWYIDRSRYSLEQYTSEIHRKITNKPNEYIGIQVSSDYTLAVNHINNYTINPETLSSGEKEALAFAFIVGLNRISETARLLMMDTPFGNLDNEHKKNIVEYLANIRSQVILLATDSDISENLLKELKPFITQICRISRLNGSEDASIIEVIK